jgi:peptide deformylase
VTILSVLKAPDPCLRKVSEPIQQIDENIRVLLDDMLETMVASDGIGLAAPQVGVSRRALVMNLSDVPEDQYVGSQRGPFRMINPIILWKSDEFISFQEGCLSVPDLRSTVDRFEQVHVQYTNEFDQSCDLKASGLLAVCLQHEIDHLDGKLFIDRLSPIRRDLAWRKLEKKNRDESK